MNTETSSPQSTPPHPDELQELKDYFRENSVKLLAIAGRRRCGRRRGGALPRQDGAERPGSGGDSDGGQDAQGPGNHRLATRRNSVRSACRVETRQDLLRCRRLRPGDVGVHGVQAEVSRGSDGRRRGVGGGIDCLGSQGADRGSAQRFYRIRRAPTTSSAQALFGRAPCLEQMGRYQEAKAVYEDFIAAHPDSGWLAKAEEMLSLDVRNSWAGKRIPTLRPARSRRSTRSA